MKKVEKLQRFLNSFLFAAIIVTACVIGLGAGYRSEKTLQTSQSAAKTAVKRLESTPDLNMIAKIVAYATSNAHFRKKKVDAEFSAMLFDDFFKLLDPSRSFFTQEDIASFSLLKNQVGTQVVKGDLSFAFNVFDLFLRRTAEYEKFAVKFIASKPSLSGKETFEPNRAKAQYAANRQELESLWRKRLTNDLILLHLQDRSAKEDEVKAEKTAKISSSPVKAKNSKAKETTLVKKAPPEQRLLKRITQFRHYYNGLEAGDVAELYLSCYLQVHDPHSQYMSPRTQEDFDINMRLSLVGIGAVLMNEDGYTKIVKIIPGGPADKDGRLKAGDKIAAVTQENGEQTDLLDMPVTKVVSYIRGKKGTRVTLSIISGASGAQKAVTLTREEVKLKDSEASGKIHTVKGANGKDLKIGVITLPSFYIDFEAAFKGNADYKSSTKDVLKILHDFSKKGPVDGLILDLRSNGGGSLYEAVTLTGLFIPSGPVVQVRDAKNCKVDEDKDGGLVAYGGPLAVLTNRLSASAAEIFAGAIQDYERGIIIGDARTHGKGTVQTLSDLSRYTRFCGMDKPAGSLKLTNAKFYRINGDSTQLRGVRSDIVFPSFAEAMELGEDKLDHAMEWDRIVPAPFRSCRMNVSVCLPILKNRSADRIAKSSEFKALALDIQAYRRIKNKKVVVLDLETRWKEYQAEKKLLEEQDRLMKVDRDDNSGKGAKKNRDIYLDEAILVVRDYADLLSASDSGN